MEEEIKFPIKPTKKTKKAFRNLHRRRVATRLMIEDINNQLADAVENAWDTLKKEHPDITTCTYNHNNQMLEQTD